MAEGMGLLQGAFVTSLEAPHKRVSEQPSNCFKCCKCNFLRAAELHCSVGVSATHECVVTCLTRNYLHMQRNNLVSILLKTTHCRAGTQGFVCSTLYFVHATSSMESVPRNCSFTMFCPAWRSGTVTPLSLSTILSAALREKSRQPARRSWSEQSTAAILRISAGLTAMLCTSMSLRRLSAATRTRSPKPSILTCGGMNYPAYCLFGIVAQAYMSGLLWSWHSCLPSHFHIFYLVQNLPKKVACSSWFPGIVIVEYCSCICGNSM